MRMSRVFGLAAVVWMPGLLSLAAVAQPPGGPGERMRALSNPEETAKAWDAQAAYVAKSLTLDEEKSKKLAEAYKTSRETVAKAGREQFLSGGGLDGYRKLVVEDRTKLEAKLKEFLTPEQTTTAIASLGTYSMQWDSMTTSLNGLGLEDAAKTGAMQAIAGFIAESSKLRESGDRDTMLEKLRELRGKLDADLAKTLSAEQLEKLKDMQGFRAGRAGREGGRRRGGEDGESSPNASAAPAPPVPAAEGAEKKEDTGKKKN